MNSEIEVKVAEEVVGSENIKITPYAIEFAGSPTIEEWHKAVLGIQKVHGMMQFYLGDLALYAESPVTGWGESKYRDLVEATGFDEQTFRVYASVARRFSKDFREMILKRVDLDQHVSKVSWTHFRIVAPLGDIPAKHFLEMVRDRNWTKEKLREAVQEYNKTKPVVDEEENLPKIGYESFKDLTKSMFKGYVPQQEDKEYDEVTWLLEIKDWAEKKLSDLGVEA